MRTYTFDHTELAQLQQCVDLGIAQFCDALRHAKNRSRVHRIAECEQGIHQLRSLRAKLI